MNELSSTVSELIEEAPTTKGDFTFTPIRKPIYKDEPPKPKTISATDTADTLYADFILVWLESLKPSLQSYTIAGYSRTVKQISEYFRETKLKLSEIKAIQIQRFYDTLSPKGLSGNSICHYHSNIRKSLQFAVKMKLIPTNPADIVDRPNIEKYHAQYYRIDSVV
ncbi:MAG: phage integrase SAM-like domain-containing protein [Oscillospiraceae bacterium]|nr:phage integrase SAM-like domain-containing protein [Oscillospiraceae bacterium]